LQEKATRLNITSPIDVVKSYIPKTFKAYDVVIIDSIQTADMSPSDFAQLKRKYPNTSFVLVSKANKDGTFKGSSDWEHDVDAVMEVKDRHVVMGKNRFPNATVTTAKAF
jgi:predicted ATP-dependent serine protease